MKLLLVDDEAGIREGLAMLLRRKGHEVATAADCATAAQALATETFEVVISDWRLPDGFAASFLATCPCPAIAISGHPEEVEQSGAVHTVLQKPVAPSRLFELVASLARKTEVCVDPSLPRDVAGLVARALAVLHEAAAARVVDDGVYVVLTAPLGQPEELDQLAGLGGDLRVLTPAGSPVIELRWCRDGRPCVDTAVYTAAEPWPQTGEFGVDFHGAKADAAAFAVWLDRAEACRSRGGLVHFLNTPEAMQSWAISQGRAHDMPMKERVGPRLPAVLADLWSEP